MGLRLWRKSSSHRVLICGVIRVIFRSQYYSLVVYQYSTNDSFFVIASLKYDLCTIRYNHFTLQFDSVKFSKFTVLYTYHCSPVLEHFHHPKKLLRPFASLSLLIPIQPAHLSFLCRFTFLHLHTDRIKQYVLFCVWLLSLSIILFCFIHVAAEINTFIPFIGK